jgi:hypothetical protein
MASQCRDDKKKRSEGSIGEEARHDSTDGRGFDIRCGGGCHDKHPAQSVFRSPTGIPKSIPPAKKGNAK